MRFKMQNFKIAAQPLSILQLWASFFSHFFFFFLRLYFCLLPLILAHKVFVTRLTRRLRAEHFGSHHSYDSSVLTWAEVTGTTCVFYLIFFVRRLSAGRVAEDQHPARLRGRHQDHLLQPEQDRWRHTAHLQSDWDLPSGGLRREQPGIWQQHAVFTHHQYVDGWEASLLSPAADRVARGPRCLSAASHWIAFQAPFTAMQTVKWMGSNISLDI